MKNKHFESKLLLRIAALRRYRHTTDIKYLQKCINKIEEYEREIDTLRAERDQARLNLETTARLYSPQSKPIYSINADSSSCARFEFIGTWPHIPLNQ